MAWSGPGTLHGTFNTRRLVQLTIESGDDTNSVMDMMLAKKRASDRKRWLQEKGDLAEV